MTKENRVEKQLTDRLVRRLGISKRGIDMKIEKIRNDRGYDITRRDAALLLASVNKIDVSKFVTTDKLKEIRALKDKEYRIESKKTKIKEKDRVLKFKDITIRSKDPFIPRKLISEAQEMSQYYALLYILENSLRNLIREAYKDKKDFLKKKVPDIEKEIQKIKSKEKYFQEKRLDDLEYAHLDWLKQIIIRNWGDFIDIFKEKDKNKLLHEVEKFLPERHCIAHTTKLKGLDANRAKYKVDEILKMYN
ncbi:MAG: hypothetical protein IIA87_04470 [Nanoarchaeota archaeon]|nr:hypothetical protein [Nanoarchaeota archaeon]